MVQTGSLKKRESNKVRRLIADCLPNPKIRSYKRIRRNERIAEKIIVRLSDAGMLKEEYCD